LKITLLNSTGEGYKVGNHIMYLDSINTTSWIKTGYNYDIGILYPLDSTYRDSKRDEILDDLFDRCNKVFLASWTDNLSYDYSEIKDYYDQQVVYDALEERPDYHQRMLDVINKPRL
jgi:hypothetical protein